ERPLVGARPVAEGTAGPQDVAVEDAAGDGVDVARQGERGSVILVGETRAGVAKAELEEAAIHEAERLHPAATVAPAEIVGGVGEVERLLRLAVDGCNARPHPECEAAGLGLGRRSRQVLAAGEPALADRAIPALQMQRRQRDGALGRRTALAGTRMC